MYCILLVFRYRKLTNLFYSKRIAISDGATLLSVTKVVNNEDLLRFDVVANMPCFNLVSTSQDNFSRCFAFEIWPTIVFYFTVLHFAFLAISFTDNFCWRNHNILTDILKMHFSCENANYSDVFFQNIRKHHF